MSESLLSALESYLNGVYLVAMNTANHKKIATREGAWKLREGVKSRFIEQACRDQLQGARLLVHRGGAEEDAGRLSAACLNARGAAPVRHNTRSWFPRCRAVYSEID